MKTILLTILVSCITLTGFAQRSKDNWNEEKAYLLEQIDSLTEVNEQLSQAVINAAIKIVVLEEIEGQVETTPKEDDDQKFYTKEEEALDLIEDYYGFYRTDYVYKETQIRRIDDNSFKVSLRECPIEMTNSRYHWSSKVLTLMNHDDGTYDISFF